jgi:hypothetical protein
MTKKTKLTVKTDVGTFTRTTARTYTHVVVAKGVRHELLEAERLAALASARKLVAEYAAVVAGLRAPLGGLGRDRYTDYLASEEARLAKLEATGPITEDHGTKWVVLGWCGRPDLAAKKVNETGRVHYYDSAARFREARAYALDGSRAF